MKDEDKIFWNPGWRLYIQFLFEVRQKTKQMTCLSPDVVREGVCVEDENGVGAARGGEKWASFLNGKNEGSVGDGELTW